MPSRTVTLYAADAAALMSMPCRHFDAAAVLADAAA